MNRTLHAIVNGKDPEELADVIELKNGTRIPSMVLDVSSEQIRYYGAASIQQESLPASSIAMLYLDHATITIPFPLASADLPWD